VVAWLVVAGWTAWWIREEALQTLPEPEDPDWWNPWSLDNPDLPLLLIGASLLAVAAVLLLRGFFRSRVRPVRGPAGPYAQAAALWLATHIALSLPDEKNPGYGLGPVAFFLLPFGALALAIAWPAIQGIDFRRVSVALGLVRGAGFWREAAVGFLAFPAVLAAENIASLVLRPGPPPPHLAIEWLTGRDEFLRVYALGFVLLYAPIVEEAAFRGLLYRMFRDATRVLPKAAGIAASSLATAFLFAVCHLQGWEQIPVLMVFGVATALLREWRRSLVAPMVVHLMAWISILVSLAAEGLL